MFFEKVEYLASTYKSGGLNYKLPKRTMYIYIYIYIFFFFFLRNHPKKRGEETISLRDINKVHKFKLQGNFLYPNLEWGEFTS